MTVSTYLTFDGNCREAFEFYRDVFGGEFEMLSTFGESPEDMGVPEELKDAVMHVSLPIGKSVLMGSDNTPEGPPLAAGNNFSLSVDAESRDHADQLLARLSAGGTVTMPMDVTFWGAYFGMCSDRFGINWMVVHELAGSAA
ncbi:MAG: VOC family protein [Gammaproteobacteria bacterium]|nr:VOC family protein [Gammaproteobacteria bacterium]